MSAFIFSTFYDKPIISLLISRIQAGSCSAGGCLLRRRQLWCPLPSERTKSKMAWCQPVDSTNFIGSMILRNPDLNNLCRIDFHGGKNISEVNSDFVLPWILLVCLSGVCFLLLLMPCVHECQIDQFGVSAFI